MPEFEVSSDDTRLDIDVIHHYLAHSYWAAGIPRNIVERSIRGSLNFGVYAGEAQVGFARVITDRATFAYLADVFVLEAWRGQGLSKMLMDAVVAHPDLRGLRRFVLVTRDAHGLYERYGFQSLARPEGYMEIARTGLYTSPA